MGNIEGLDKFMNYIDRVAINVDNIINESLEETATMVIADTKLSTPVPSKNWSIKTFVDSWGCRTQWR